MGCRLLVVGRWLSVIGCRLSVFGHRSIANRKYTNNQQPKTNNPHLDHKVMRRIMRIEETIALPCSTKGFCSF